MNQPWYKFLDDISKAKNEIGLDEDWNDSAECWYRGHSMHTFSLLPSLFRCGWSGRNLYRNEIDLYYEFRSRARQLHEMQSSWDVMFAMQHYGVPTRVLDWTENFAVALFFAITYQPANISRPQIWLLNPYRLNDISVGLNDLYSPRNLGWDEDKKVATGYDNLILEKDGIWWKHPVALYPEMRNERLQAQSGMFTIHGWDDKPLEEQYKDELSRQSTFLKQVDIPFEAIDAAKKFLYQSGTHYGAMFPDLSGLAVHLKRRYGY